MKHLSLAHARTFAPWRVSVRPPIVSLPSTTRPGRSTTSPGVSSRLFGLRSDLALRSRWNTSISAHPPRISGYLDSNVHALVPQCVTCQDGYFSIFKELLS
jgi:hypothetical protein